MTIGYRNENKNKKRSASVVSIFILLFQLHLISHAVYCHVSAPKFCTLFLPLIRAIRAVSRNLH